MDLLLPEPSRKGNARPNIVPEQPPKLEIKKDPKGLVTVMGSTTIAATSAKQLLGVIEQVCFTGDYNLRMHLLLWCKSVKHIEHAIHNINSMSVTAGAPRSLATIKNISRLTTAAACRSGAASKDTCVCCCSSNVCTIISKALWSAPAGGPCSPPAVTSCMTRWCLLWLVGSCPPPC